MNSGYIPANISRFAIPQGLLGIINVGIKKRTVIKIQYVSRRVFFSLGVGKRFLERPQTWIMISAVMFEQAIDDKASKDLKTIIEISVVINATSVAISEYLIIRSPFLFIQLTPLSTRACGMEAEPQCSNR